MSAPSSRAFCTSHWLVGFVSVVSFPLGLIACADVGPAGGGGASASTDGPGGGGGATAQACPAGHELWSQAGVRYVPESDCVDVTAESILFIDNCRPLVNESAVDFEFQCFRRLADGAEYWISLYGKILPIEGEWEFCDGAPSEGLRPPRPCFAVCPDTEIGHEEPLSTCAEGATRQFYACGLESKWDENCCRRKYCDESQPCPDGFECREAWVTTPASYCWVGIGPNVDPASVDLNNAAEACSCIGAVNPPDTYCFPSKL